MAPTSAFKYLNKLRGNRVLVLGGSTGIGFAVAEAAVEHGAIVIVSSSNQTKLDNAIARLQSHAKAVDVAPGNVSGKICDLANSETIEENVTQLVEFATAGGQLNHVVYTAGNVISLPALTTVSMEEIHRSAMVRQYAIVFLAKHLPKYAVSDVASSFTLTGSSMGSRPGPNWSVMAGILGAVEGHMRGFAVDLKPIRVNMVQLGIIPTEFHQQLPKEIREALFDHAVKDNITATLGKPEDVAEAYMYCLKDKFVTGSNIVTNGGQFVGRSSS